MIGSQMLLLNSIASSGANAGGTGIGAGNGSIHLTVISDDAELTGNLESSLREEFTIKTISVEAAHQPRTGALPDVVLLDITAGSMSVDPASIVAALAEDRVPVVVIADDGARDQVVDLLECGAEDHVSKPLAMRELR